MLHHSTSIDLCYKNHYSLLLFFMWITYSVLSCKLGTGFSTFPIFILAGKNVMVYEVLCKNTMVGCRNEIFWYGSLQENYGSLQEYEKIMVHSRNSGWLQGLGSLQELSWFSAGIFCKCWFCVGIIVWRRNCGSVQE